MSIWLFARIVFLTFRTVLGLIGCQPFVTYVLVVTFVFQTRAYIEKCIVISRAAESCVFEKNHISGRRVKFWTVTMKFV